MKLVIDADGCPVVALAVKTAEKYGVRCVLVCDTAHTFSNVSAEIITVSQGADSADFRIVNLLDAGATLWLHKTTALPPCALRKTPRL